MGVGKFLVRKEGVHMRRRNVLLVLVIPILFWGCSSGKGPEAGKTGPTTPPGWTAVSASLGYEDYIYDIAIVEPPDNIWAVGTYGKIFHYNGKEWQSVPSPTKLHLFGLAFPRPDEGWAVGASSNILHYNGQAWEKVEPPVHCYLSGVSFASPQEGWAVGNNGVILHYTADKGWQVYPSPTKVNLYSVQLISPDNGWIVGAGGTILHYNGQKWQPLASPTEMVLSKVSFRIPNEGFAAGAAGTLLRYDGKEWKLVESPGRDWFYVVAAMNPEGIWVAGRNRNFFHKKDRGD